MTIKAEDLGDVNELITGVQRLRGTIAQLKDKGDNVDDVYFSSLYEFDDGSGDLLVGTTPVRAALLLAALEQTLVDKKKTLAELGAEIE